MSISNFGSSYEVLSDNSLYNAAIYSDKIKVNMNNSEKFTLINDPEEAKKNHKRIKKTRRALRKDECSR